MEVLPRSRPCKYSPYLTPYILDIQENRIQHCRDQKLLIENVLLPVLARDDVYVDDDRIAQGLTLQKYFPFKLLPWEVFLFAVIVGIRFRDTDRIYFTDIRIILGRGSGKNGFIDFLCVYFLSPFHGIQGYDVDLLANSEAQVKTSFLDVHDLITNPCDAKLSPVLKAHFSATLTSVVGLQTRSVLRYNTSSKRGKDSKRTGCIILDEIHEYLDFSNINTLKSGLGKRVDGRCISISTFGHVRGAVFDRQMDQNQAILCQYNPRNRTFPFVCRIESEDEWKNPDCWVKAIPSLPWFPTLRETIEKEVEDMPYTPEYWPEFMAKRMNCPVGNKDVEVASWDDILATNRPLPNLLGRPCAAAMDYAKTNDFVTCVLLFQVGNDLAVLQHTFVCRSSRDLPGIKAPLDEWARNGDLEFVDGPEIPPELPAEWFAQQGASYDIVAFAIDNYRFALMRAAIQAVGFGGDSGRKIKLTRPSDLMKVHPVINSAFVRKRFVWGDLPIMRWFTNNTKVVSEGLNSTYGKIEPHYRKTDGFMALAHAMTLLDELDAETTSTVELDPMIF